MYMCVGVVYERSCLCVLGVEYERFMYMCIRGRV